MNAQMVNRIDGRWHIEVSYDSEEERNLILGMSARKKTVKSVGALLIIESSDELESEEPKQKPNSVGARRL